MNQVLLFPDLLADRRTAIEADIDAGGGLQKVGHQLGLHEDPVNAGRLLSNKINQNGRHRLSDEETWRIKELAREKVGKSRLHELECSALAFEGGKWLTSEDIKARKRKRKQQLLAELLALEEEDE